MKKILVVDDEPLNRLLLCECVKKHVGNNVATARNGKEAIDMLVEMADTANVLLLLDLNMPIMDGYEVLEYIRDHYLPEKRPTIILITASYYKAVQESGLEKLVTCYHQKPIDIERLVKDVLTLAV